VVLTDTRIGIGCKSFSLGELNGLATQAAEEDGCEEWCEQMLPAARALLEWRMKYYPVKEEANE